jgi:hypothetical protein
VEKTVDVHIVDLIQAEGTGTSFGIPDPTFVQESSRGSVERHQRKERTQ